jgi:hypothetical protein
MRAAADTGATTESTAAETATATAIAAAILPRVEETHVKRIVGLLLLGGQLMQKNVTWLTEDKFLVGFFFGLREATTNTNTKPTGYALSVG